MAEATSPSTGHRCGVVRVCRAWEVARSSFYAARQAEADTDGSVGNSVWGRTMPLREPSYATTQTARHPG